MRHLQDCYLIVYTKASTKLPQRTSTSSYKATEMTTKWNRMNGEIRDREKKTMSGLKRNLHQILQGYQLHHNSIREHQALNGKTPAEVCGISKAKTNC
jgi:hypothetical protein